MTRRLFDVYLTSALTLVMTVQIQAQDAAKSPRTKALAEIKAMDVKPHDWPQWGGWSHKNNVPEATGIPTEFDVEAGEGVLWKTPLGSQTYGNVVVANGQIYVGTNNHHGYVGRFPKEVDLGVLLCLDEKSGEFKWQHSSPKLSTGRVHDWPDQGICCSPYVDGERLWYVTSRGEVVCLDTQGFLDDENDGPYTSEAATSNIDADIIWRFDMMGQLGVSQHNMCNCSIVGIGDTIFVNTSNGVDESHVNIPAPNAASFIAMNRDTGEVLWSDKSPGLNILHGQWSSPSYCVVDGQAQIMFGGGDGWLYSFDPEGDGSGNSKLLWKFDSNPKDSMYSVSGRSERNHLIGTPVTCDGLVYIGVGEDPEHGEGNGHLWCIDPTKRGDISPTIALDKDGKEIEFKNDGTRRLQKIHPDAGESTKENSNSGVVWHYTGYGPHNGYWVQLGEHYVEVTLEDNKVVLYVYEDDLRTPKSLVGQAKLTVNYQIKEEDELVSKTREYNLVSVESSNNLSKLTIEEELPVDDENEPLVNSLSSLKGTISSKGDSQDYESELNHPEFEDEMHRTCGTVAILDDILYVADFSGIVHCLNAKTGKPYWHYDMFSAAWGSPLIVDGKVYIGDEDGDIAVFKHAKEMDLLAENLMDSSVYSTPIVANGVLYISTRDTLYAIGEKEAE